MSDEFHRLDNQKTLKDLFNWSKFFTIFFVSSTLSLILFFVLAVILSGPAIGVIIQFPNTPTQIARLIFMLLPMILTVFVMLPIFLRKYYIKKNNVVLYLLGMVIFISIALVMGVLIEFISFSAPILSNWSNQSIFNVILTSMYFYFMFDQEVFHGGFSNLNPKLKILSIICYILPNTAIIFRVLDLDWYPTIIENIFLALPTLILVFFTLFDIMIQSIKLAKRLSNQNPKYRNAYVFIGLSSLILLVFFLIFAVIIVFELYYLSLLYVGNLILLSIVILLLYMGYIWPTRAEEKRSDG